MATTFPIAQAQRVRHNWLAILAAAIACFLLEAVWYSFFIVPWMSGIDRSQQWLTSHGANVGIRFAVAIAAEFAMGVAISCVLQLTGPQTAWRGAKTGAMLWLGFNVTVWATEYIFEVRPWSLFAINAGYWLLGMMLMGAIIGAWKKR